MSLFRDRDSASGHRPDEAPTDLPPVDGTEAFEDLDFLDPKLIRDDGSSLSSSLSKWQHFELEIELSPEDCIDSLRLVHSDTGELLTSEAELHVGALSAPGADVPAELSTKEALVSRIRHDLVHPLGWRLYIHYFPESEQVGLLEAGVEVFTTSVHQYLFPDDT